MSSRIPSTWLPRWLFRLSLATASLLIAIVCASPWLCQGIEGSSPVARVLRLFAQERVLRRTTIISAVGLTVSAYVFFWTPAQRRIRRETDRATTNKTVVGA